MTPQNQFPVPCGVTPSCLRSAQVFYPLALTLSLPTVSGNSCRTLGPLCPHPSSEHILALPRQERPALSPLLGHQKPIHSRAGATASGWISGCFKGTWLEQSSCCLCFLWPIQCKTFSPTLFTGNALRKLQISTTNFQINA